MFDPQAWSWVILSILFTAKAVIVNKTIDDTYGDGGGNFVNYLPEGAWNVGGCSECSAQPEMSRLYSQSWHDGDVR